MMSANIGRSVAAMVLGAVLAAGAQGPAWAQDSDMPLDLTRPQNASPVSVPSTPHGGEFIVPVHKSQLLQLDQPYSEVSIGNPEIADVVPLTKRMVYVLGKGLGSTNLSFIGADGEVIAVVDLVISYDLEGLKSKLHELMPEEEIRIYPAGSAIVLSGQVSSARKLNRAMAVARRFAPESVTNFMSVGGDQQVMLSVRFAEVQRSVVKELGFNNLLSTEVGNLAGLLLTGVGASAEAFAVGELVFQRGDLTIESLFDALEDKGLVKTLAEPNLIVLSGDTADFLAGGEFPIPVAQEGDEGGFTITIEFKEFGVSLAFTPTVLEGDLMNLVLRTEVSAIDPTVSVTTQGISVPGLTVRRAKTTVELRDGQTFAIAGLLQDDFRDQVDQLPWLGEVPVLGTLFRSTSYQRSQTELVVVITPRLVQPALAGTLATPVDKFRMPDEFDLFMKGELEGTPAASVQTLSQSGAGGFDGDYGYILK